MNPSCCLSVWESLKLQCGSVVAAATLTALLAVVLCNRKSPHWTLCAVRFPLTNVIRWTISQKLLFDNKKSKWNIFLHPRDKWNDFWLKTKEALQQWQSRPIKESFFDKIRHYIVLFQSEVVCCEIHDRCNHEWATTLCWCMSEPTLAERKDSHFLSQHAAFNQVGTQVSLRKA